jgi:hypothetical protein
LKSSEKKCIKPGSSFFRLHSSEKKQMIMHFFHCPENRNKKECALLKNYQDAFRFDRIANAAFDLFYRA